MDVLTLNRSPKSSFPSTAGKGGKWNRSADRFVKAVVEYMGIYFRLFLFSQKNRSKNTVDGKDRRGGLRCLKRKKIRNIIYSSVNRFLKMYQEPLDINAYEPEAEPIQANACFSLAKIRHVGAGTK